MQAQAARGHVRSPGGPRRRLVVAAGAALVAAVAAGSVPAGTAAAAGGPTPAAAPAAPVTAAAPARDGRTPATALASCWDVKQSVPGARDGLYWLQTPALVVPQQFWCDQTTDGGGWVLIGRGRQGWAFLPEGQGTPAEVYGTRTGTAAFAPKHLPAATVDALLNGGAVSALDDGLRIRRASNAAGTTWQEVRLHLPGMAGFRWTLGGGYRVDRVVLDGEEHTGGFSSARVAIDDAYKTVGTQRTRANEFKPGFGYGPGVTGTAGGYLWARAAGEGEAVPFAQAWLRPRLRSAALTYPATTAALPAQTRPRVARNEAEPARAGVTGQANGFTSERDTEVRAMVQIGSRMYVGGNFGRIHDYTRRTSVARSYLAAFDVATGAHVPAFSVVLDGKVNALAALPGGRIAVGGEFRRVNGRVAGGLAVLNATTGALAPGWSTGLQSRRTTISPGTVTALSVSGTRLYAGGQFTHVSGGVPNSGYVPALRAARFSTTDGRPDPAWHPDLGATPLFVVASAKGDRVYAGGFFTTMNGTRTAAPYFVTLTTSTPATQVAGLRPWVPSTPKKPYQQAGFETDTRFWLAGAEHAFQAYNRSDMALVRGAITAGDLGSGGDFQAAVVDGSVAYGSCHCTLSYNYGTATNWPSPTGFDRIDTLRYVGAYDRNGRAVSSFTPWIETRAVRGPWSLVMDSRGCLWTGGDLTRTRSRTTGTWQASAGFARFCRSDSTAPTAPAGLTARRASGSVTLAWRASTDASGPVRYLVYRDDRVVTTTKRTTVALPDVGAARYTVRAQDAAGNRSATPPAVRS